MQDGVASGENNFVVPQKLKHGVPYDPTIPLLGATQERWNHIHTIPYMKDYSSSSQKVETKISINW